MLLPATAGVALGHGNSESLACANNVPTLTISLSKYALTQVINGKTVPVTNTVTITIDGVLDSTDSNANFGTTYSLTKSLSPATSSHSATVVVLAGDDLTNAHGYSPTYNLSVPPCQGSLTITKAFAGIAPVAGTYNFSVSCTGFSTTASITVGSAPYTTTVSGIPAPNSCTVAETSAPTPPTTYSAWVTTYSTSGGVTAVTTTTPGAVTVTNTTSHIPPGQGDFQFSKTVGGNLNGWTGGQFSFTVTCGTSKTTVTLTVGSTGSTVSSQIFGPYDPGTVCSVTEGNLPAAGTYASWVNSPIYSPVSASATIVSDQTVTVAVTNTRSRSDPTPTPLQSFQGETAYPSGTMTVEGATGTPVRVATPPVTSTDGSSPSGDSMPLFALLICLSFGGLGLLAVQAQRQSIRK
jgi:hypothetical protein